MVKVKILATGEVREVTNNVAFGLIDSGQATLLKDTVRTTVTEKEQDKDLNSTYPTRQMRPHERMAYNKPDKKGYSTK